MFDFAIISIALFSIGLTVWICAQLWQAIKEFKDLNAVSPSKANPEISTAPLISVVLAARNEEKDIGSTLHSLLKNGYPNLEIIAVDDRSTDTTGTVLDYSAEENQNIRVIHINDLPEGWMGKNYALHRGAELAQGDYILFTDADIHMEQSVLARAVAFALRQNLGHLCLVFESRTERGFLKAMMTEIFLLLSLRYKPWKASRPGSKHYIGIGAFNLVSAETYRKCGGHRKIAMTPLDDIMLGKLIKNNGYRQDCLNAIRNISVPWYESFQSMLTGLEKNIYAVFDFKLAFVARYIAVQFLVGVLPLWLALFASGFPRGAGIIVLVIRLTIFAVSILRQGGKTYHALYSLITPYATMYMVIRNVIKTISQRGIQWRGTKYALPEMQAKGKN